MAMANAMRAWTLEELHRLPDDGNKYELVFGELFVTPAPSQTHETIAARLAHALDPFVAANGLGMVYRPRAVMRYEGSEVEPDLMVRAEELGEGDTWSSAPVPILVVEIASPTTRRRDKVQKRRLYLAAGVAEYWLVDAGTREVCVVRSGAADVFTSDFLVWTPVDGASLRIDMEALFAGVPTVPDM